MTHWQARLWASGIHLAISVTVATLAALLVFGWWYPYPYREISGGRELFLILVTVDVLMGPLITLTIFNLGKSRRELGLDLAVIGLLQLAALGYGLWTVAVARPVHLVFEIDRFRVVHAVDVPDQLLELAPRGLEAMPWTGPTLLGTRPFRSDQEKFEATMAALQGVAIGARPDLWQPYELTRAQVLRVGRPADQLKSRFPARAAEIDAVLASVGRGAPTASYVPLVGRKSFWTVFVDPVTANVMTFMPLDSF